MDWESVREQCIRSGEKARVDKAEGVELPPYVHETHLGISKDAIRQYRDDRPINSLHIHEYDDYFLVHVDAFNPESHPLAHGIVDTPGLTVGIVAGAIACFLVAKAIHSMSFLPSDRSNASEF